MILAELTVSDLSPALREWIEFMTKVGGLANQAAQHQTFTEYHQRKSRNTNKAQLADLSNFAAFLESISLSAGGPMPPRGEEFQDDPVAWTGITWGLIRAYLQWMVVQGYAVTTINRRLSTLQAYANLAAQAGALGADEYQLIKGLSGYSLRDGRRMDAQRPRTRMGLKKAEAVILTLEQAERMKHEQPDSPQGCRDAVIATLLLDHGLRVGELVGLQTSDVRLAKGQLHFFRPKIGEWHTHQLTADSLDVLSRWLDAHAIAGERLLRTSSKTGELLGPGITERSARDRVRLMGEGVGVEGLSPHDCRHFWTWRASAGNTDIRSLQEGGGWKSIATVQRYMRDLAVKNSGVRLAD